MSVRLRVMMQRLGFDESAIIIYHHLLTGGAQTTRQLEGELRITPRACQHAMRRLRRLRLVGKDDYKGRPRYYATEPTLAWLALVADTVWGHSSKIGSIRNLPDTGIPAVERQRRLCEAASREAAKLFVKPHLATKHHRERDAEDPDELAQLTCELIYQARREIRAVSISPRLPHVSQFWVVLTERIKAGVTYTRIVDLDEFIDHGLSIVERDMRDYSIDLRFIERGRIRHGFYLVDDRFLAVLDKDAATVRDRPISGRVTDHHHIVRRYRQRFDSQYAISIPGSFVCSHLRNCAKNLLAHVEDALSNDERRWLESLIEMGKFSQYWKENNWSERELDGVIERALSAGLVRRNHEGLPVPAYRTSEAAIRAGFEASMK